jgi:hypothetical protein
MWKVEGPFAFALMVARVGVATGKSSLSNSFLPEQLLTFSHRSPSPASLPSRSPSG